jgi:hypothetical protein
MLIFLLISSLASAFLRQEMSTKSRQEFLETYSTGSMSNYPHPDELLALFTSLLEEFPETLKECHFG